MQLFDFPKEHCINTGMICVQNSVCTDGKRRRMYMNLIELLLMVRTEYKIRGGGGGGGGINTHLNNWLSSSRWHHDKNVWMFHAVIDTQNIIGKTRHVIAWWRRHQVETFSASLALYAGNSPVTGKLPSQRPVTQSFNVFFELCLNTRLSKQSWGWWL